jgi:hypothetical protein
MHAGRSRDRVQPAPIDVTPDVTATRTRKSYNAGHVSVDGILGFVTLSPNQRRLCS